MIAAIYRPIGQGVKIRSQARTYLTAILLCALFFQVVQIALVNTQLSSIRLALAGVTLALLTISALVRVREGNYHAGVSIAYAFTMLAGWAISILLLGGAVDWNVIGIQLAFPIYLGAMGAQDSRALLRWVTLVSAGIVLYAATYAVTNPRLVIDLVPRAQGFLEIRAPHNSAYMVGSIFIFFYIAGAIQRRIPKWLWIPLLLICAILLYAYKVRTAQVMVMGFLGTLGIQYLKPRYGIAPIIAISLLAISAAFSYVSTNSEDELFKFSSGRTSVYVERLALMAERNLFETLLGSGPGTDNFYSQAWWWEAKNSHNDFLTTAIERGLVGLALLIWYLSAFCRARRPETIAIVTAIVLTGLVSNGLFQRPLPLLFTAFAVWASATGRSVHGKSN